jgi:sulfide dehydrogenase [flavocytochrome c] flavoprotein subunit
MNRRTFLNMAAIGGAAAFGGCATQTVETAKASPETAAKPAPIRPKTKKRIVIVGGGFGGLNTASTIKSYDPKNELEVIVVERNRTYFTCPMSNTLLSGDPRFKREDFLFDYIDAQLEYNYEVMQAEVTGIDREAQRVSTSRGELEYDFLVLAPGIEYNYAAEFPHWSPEKVRRARLEAPGGLESDVGVEHSILLKQLEAFKARGGEGVIAIIPPRLKFTRTLEESIPHSSVQRCKPAPYERACMIGNWIKANNLVGKAKVLVLDNSTRPQAKPAAFEQVFEELYKGIVEYRGGFDLMDVDFDKKEIFYRDIDDNADYIQSRLKYDILNLIPVQKASSLIEKAGLKSNAWGGAVLARRNFYSVTDDRVYVIGDSAFYGKGTFADNPKKMAGVPAAAQTAYSTAIEAGRMIADRLLRNIDKPVDKFSASCFSMVRSDTGAQLGIAIEKDFNFSDKGMTITERIPTENGKYYTKTAGEGIVGWFSAVTSATFAKF